MSLLSRLLQRKSALQSTLKPGDRPADSVAALIAHGNEQFQAGDFAEACEAYKQVLELEPGNARAYYMLGSVALNDRDVPSGIGLVQRAIELAPTVPDFHFSLAGVYLSQGYMNEALASYREAARLQPDSLAYRRAVAGALLAAGRMQEGIEAYRAIALTSPSDGTAYFELGKALQLAGDLKEAEEVLVKATALSPQSEGAHLHLAVVQREQGRPVEAEAAARRAVALAPDMYQTWFVLGGVLGDQGRHAEAVESFRKVLALDANDDAAWSGVLFAMNYSERFSRREVFEEHAKYGRLFPAVPAMSIDAARSKPGRRLRIGYLSPDFWQHPVAHFMAPILAHHDQHRFELFCYHTGKREDAMSARLKKGIEHWRWLPTVTDDALERMLREDQLDIVVELTGHSDRQRLAVLARRVAPVQVTYLGYPNTTGVATIDYRITDARADPPGESDQYHVEKLIRLPETFLCYAPPAAAGETPAAPAHRTGTITFASFNNFAKLSPITISLWSRVLVAVPGSKLLIKTRGLQDPGLRALLLKRFREQGIDSARIEIMQPIVDSQQHLKTYGDVDIALDPFPYHGTTTTMEALWMGVPVLTLQGDRHSARVGSSILGALDLTDLIAQSEAQYVDIAVRLASDLPALDALRQSLRPRLSRSILTDGARFTAHLEQAYVQMWQETLSRSSPGSARA